MTTTRAPVITVVTPQHDRRHGDVINKSMAGIVSGCVLTTLVLGCVMFVFCRLQHKKQTQLRTQEQQQVFLQKKVYEAGDEMAFVLPDNFRYKSLETVTDSVAPTNCSTELTNFRHLTGSSTSYIAGSPCKHEEESVILPFNPPPSAISSNLDDISLCATSQTFSTFQQMDAPPPTPLYTPSMVESERGERSSVLLGPLGLDVMRAPHSSECHSLLTDYSYDGPPKSHLNCMCHTNKQHELYMSRPAPSLASSYVSSMRHPLNSHNSCGNSSIDSRRRQSLTRQLSHITCVADSIVHNGGNLPSLASGENTSSSSVSSQKTIRHISDNCEADSNVFNSYAPPPSPREMHPLVEQLGEFEVAFLLEESPEEMAASSMKIF